MVFEGLVQDDTVRCLGYAQSERTNGVDHVCAFDDQVDWVNPVQASDMFEQPLANKPARAVDGATAHPGLAGGRCRPRRSDVGVDGL